MEAVNESMTNIAKAKELINSFNNENYYVSVAETIILLDKTLELLSKI